MFRNEAQDWFQGRCIVLTSDCAPDLIVFNGYINAATPDEILRIHDKKILLSDLLLYTAFVPSRAELHRAYKDGSLKLNGATVRAEVEIPLTVPDPFIEVRRARRCLEVVVNSPEKIKCQ